MFDQGVAGFDGDAGGGVGGKDVFGGGGGGGVLEVGEGFVADVGTVVHAFEGDGGYEFIGGFEGGFEGGAGAGGCEDAAAGCEELAGRVASGAGVEYVVSLGVDCLLEY